MSSSQSPSTASEPVYHLELRHFPRNVCRFNLSGEELRTKVLEPWVADRPFDLGELRWDPRHAQITVIEGPRIPLERLSMGRGWRTAQRAGREVTAQMLAAVGEALAGRGGEAQRGSPPAETSGGAPAGVAAPAPGASEGPELAPGLGPEGAGGRDRPADPSRSADPIADSLGLRLLAQIGDAPTPLRRAWELASAHDPGRPASETLAIAERAVASLLGVRLIVLLCATEPGSTPEAMDAQDALTVLRALESWADLRISIRRV
jgi:hypothetical protein